MKIPRRFSLLGHHYAVHIIPKAQWKDEGCVALLEPQSDRILIMKSHKAAMEHAFLHELMHAVFNAMGRDKLYRDEALVDTVAGLLHQALTSAE